MSCRTEQIRNGAASLVTLFALLYCCPRSFGAQLNGKELLEKLHSFDQTVLQHHTLVTETLSPAKWGSLEEGEKKTKVTLTRDGNAVAVEHEIFYTEDPSYRERARPAMPDYDALGNLLVWRVTRRRNLLEPDFQAHQMKGVHIRVSPDGDLSETEGAPTVDFYKPSDTRRFLDFWQTVWATGRGFASSLSQITEVNQKDGGLIGIRAKGTFAPRMEGSWEMSIDPNAGYLVRSASFTNNGQDSPVFLCRTTGTKWFDGCCLAKEATLTSGPGSLENNMMTTKIEQFKAEVDIPLFTKLRGILRSPLPKDTDVFDFRVDLSSPLRYRVGKLPMTNRALLDVVANAEPVIGDSNHAAPAQVRVVSDANDEPIDTNHPEQDSAGDEPNRDTNPYKRLILAAAIVLIAAIGVFYARKRGKN